MSEVTIYHNPRCSKSRETLQLLEQHNIQPNIVLYLDAHLTATTIADLIKKLGLHSARELMRHKETLYRELNLADSQLTESQLIATMVKHPKLIERPIVVKGNQARLGRPPEKVLEII